MTTRNRVNARVTLDTGDLDTECCRLCFARHQHQLKLSVEKSLKRVYPKRVSHQEL